MVDVNSDTSIQVQWGPPTQSNGILTHYTVVVFNKLTSFNSSTQVDISDADVLLINVTGLSTYYNILHDNITLITQVLLCPTLCKCLHQQRLEEAIQSLITSILDMEVS